MPSPQQHLTGVLAQASVNLLRLGIRLSGECFVWFVQGSCYSICVLTLPWSADQEPASCVFQIIASPSYLQVCLSWTGQFQVFHNLSQPLFPLHFLTPLMDTAYCGSGAPCSSLRMPSCVIHVAGLHQWSPKAPSKLPSSPGWLSGLLCWVYSYLPFQLKVVRIMQINIHKHSSIGCAAGTQGSKVTLCPIFSSTPLSR